MQGGLAFGHRYAADFKFGKVCRAQFTAGILPCSVPTRLRNLDTPVARIFAVPNGFTSSGIIGFILSLFNLGCNKQRLVPRAKIRKVMMGRSTGASRTKRANHGWLVLCTLPVPSPIRAPTHGRPSFHKGRFKILATLSSSLHS